MGGMVFVKPATPWQDMNSIMLLQADTAREYRQAGYFCSRDFLRVES